MRRSASKTPLYVHIGISYENKHPKSQTLSMRVFVCMHMGHHHGHLVVSLIELACTSLSFGLLCGRQNALW